MFCSRTWTRPSSVSASITALRVGTAGSLISAMRDSSAFTSGSS
jgi:hypothetical protein